VYSEFELLLTGQQYKQLSDKKYEALMKEYKLRRVELDILYFIANAGIHDTASDIMNRRHLSKAHISKSVRNLKKRGFIQVDEDPDDRRILHIHITPKAYPVIMTFEALHDQLRETLFAGITPEERETMNSVVRKMLTNINEDNPDF
jgi:DNA-binding MarR family transcriptional regulator